MASLRYVQVIIPDSRYNFDFTKWCLIQARLKTPATWSDYKESLLPDGMCVNAHCVRWDVKEMPNSLIHIPYN